MEMSDDIKDAPWVGMSREEYERESSHYSDEYEEYLATKADDDYKAAQEEELIRRKRHADEVWSVYEYLTAAAIGEANAVSARSLSRHFGVNERKLRDIINEIRTSSDFEKVIGSCSRGYFVCSTVEEVDHANNALRHHALSELQVYWANERKAGRNGQGKIICGEDGKPFIESLARAE